VWVQIPPLAFLQYEGHGEYSGCSGKRDMTVSADWPLCCAICGLHLSTRPNNCYIPSQFVARLERSQFKYDLCSNMRTILFRCASAASALFGVFACFAVIVAFSYRSCDFATAISNSLLEAEQFVRHLLRIGG
jgi:hypothetical protein